MQKEEESSLVLASAAKSAKAAKKARQKASRITKASTAETPAASGLASPSCRLESESGCITPVLNEKHFATDHSAASNAIQSLQHPAATAADVSSKDIEHWMLCAITKVVLHCITTPWLPPFTSGCLSCTYVVLLCLVAQSNAKPCFLTRKDNCTNCTISVLMLEHLQANVQTDVKCPDLCACVMRPQCCDLPADGTAGSHAGPGGLQRWAFLRTLCH